MPGLRSMGVQWSLKKKGLLFACASSRAAMRGSSTGGAHWRYQLYSGKAGLATGPQATMLTTARDCTIARSIAPAELEACVLEVKARRQKRSGSNLVMRWTTNLKRTDRPPGNALTCGDVGCHEAEAVVDVNPANEASAPVSVPLSQSASARALKHPHVQASTPVPWREILP